MPPISPALVSLLAPPVAPLVAPLLALLLAQPPSPASSAAPSPDAAVSVPGDAESALKEGNRLFRAGRLDEALTAYRTGWDPHHPDPVLAYNLGTTAHHLGRLPEAVLWYRRAARASADDRWLTDNLERARNRLESPRWPPSDTAARVVRRRDWLWIGTALVGWGALALLLAGRPRLQRWADLLAMLAAAMLTAALVLPHLASVPVVVLEPCGEKLPAGSEVWARPDSQGGFTVGSPGGSLHCPPGAAEPVGP